MAIYNYVLSGCVCSSVCELQADIFNAISWIWPESISIGTVEQQPSLNQSISLVYLGMWEMYVPLVRKIFGKIGYKIVQEVAIS